MNAAQLRTDFLAEPMGLGNRRPRLSWTCDGGTRQTAYRIVAGDWDSGKVASSAMHADFPRDAEDREAVRWRVMLWDENDVPGDWSEASFEMGISSWQASWISGDYAVNPSKRYPADCFRKTFTCLDIARARLYITACGVYEACVNGVRVGNFILAPGITDYRLRVQYQTYDVTALLREGENELTVWLADGWYRGSCGAWGLRNQYGTRTKLLAQLEWANASGAVTAVCTDDTWAWSNDGPIRGADNKDGEIFDANLAPTYSGRARKARHKVVPTASDNVPVTEHETFSAELLTTPSGQKVLNFGQNIAGYVRFSVIARKGQTLKLRFGELLDQAGEFTQKNIQLSMGKKTTPLQEVVYTCREGLNDYKTRFAIFGFQYVLVEGDAEIRPEDFTAIAVYSAMEETSEFDSSNELLNRFYRSVIWSAKNNSCDLPTDCPTRERHGWSGDAEIFCPTASYLFNYEPFIAKYIRDLRDCQYPNGNIVQIAPRGGTDFYMRPMDGSAGWSDAIVLIPWTLYKQYGSLNFLRDCYPAMRRYADFKRRTLGKWYLTSVPTGIGLRNAGKISNYGQSYGEWAEPADVCAFKISDFISPHPEETTAYIVYVMEIMTEIARLLGHADDASRFNAFADKAREGYRALLKTKKFSPDVDRQAKQVRPLYLDLADEEQTAFLEKRLLMSLDNYGWRLGTGFLSTPFILPVLTKMDPEYAYRLLENEEIPGWLSMPKAGANTVWEAWEGPNSTSGGIGSLDHYSKGAALEWVFGTMCGIRVDGENHFAIAPIPGGHFTHATLRYRSVYGPVESAWQREEDRTTYTFSVPANCTATVTLAGRSEEYGPGRYTVTV